MINKGKMIISKQEVYDESKRNNIGNGDTYDKG
jgi:hypothetical protein